MASVTEEMLQNIASDIVREFNSGGTSLTEGVRKKAADNGFNRDQTARLIERTNSEAFMSLFPKQTDFPVANPEEVLGEKVASEKVAKKTYKQMVDRDLSEIFGIEPHEKVASIDHAEHILKTSAMFAEFQALSRMLEETRMAKIAQEIRTEELCNAFFGMVKEAVYTETPLSSIELELLHDNPDNPEMVCAVMDEIAEKLASDPFLPEKLLDRADVDAFDPDAVVPDGKFAAAFRGVLNGFE